MRRLVLIAVLAGSALVAGVLPAGASAATLRAGVGKADVTPQLGYYLGGWTRADRIAQGQHTRLFSRALVLQEGDRKIALIQVDLFMVSGGLLKTAADLNADRGFSERNVLASASHTHSGPGGYANFKTFNTAAPSLQTATDPISYYQLFDPKPADPQLYSFLVRQIAKAIRRADNDLGPAAAGWGHTELEGVTENRSIEAHLADHGILREFGEGGLSLDPGGYVHTIDPDVNVLRVDKVVKRKGKRRRMPIGGWSTFADHGTVTKSSFQFYNQDHFASAMQVFESKVRKAGKVPAKQEVLNVYGNSNEGDQSAGLHRDGPAASDYVGRREATAMFRAWRSAGKSLSRSPALDSRWTRVCFCGQATEGGNVADFAMIGLPFLTGSEEERGPLYDITHHAFEGTRNPLPVPGQGHKEGIPLSADSVPKAVPLMQVRVGDRLIASMPGEATTEAGRRLKAAVLAAAAPAGVRKVIESGLANEFIQYLTTPEEYDRQHYEGGSTLYGPLSVPFLVGQQAEMAKRLAAGQPAQEAYPFDPTNGVTADAAPYDPGAAGGAFYTQPNTTRRLGHAVIAWRGGPLGHDRPVDRAFVTVERKVKKRWKRAASDLGLAMLWHMDGSDRYVAKWEIPLTAKRGFYRMVVHANRYKLVSRRFKVRNAKSLTLRQASAKAGRVAVSLSNPPAVRDVDLTYRPVFADGGVVRFRVGKRVRVVKRKHGGVFSVKAPAGRAVTVLRARDRNGNIAPGGLALKH